MVRSGVTIVEVLVAIGIIGLLVAITLPAIQLGRESGRRATCSDNLRQVATALLSHEGSHGALPIGARKNGTFGVSWFARILPYVEQLPLYNRLDLSGPHAGSMLLNSTNASAANQVVIPLWRCPSSPIPPLYSVGAVEVMMPSYVGISGSSSDQVFPEKRVATCCIPERQGQISAGGVLIPNRAVRLAEILDGLSNTLAVGECSDVASDSSGVIFRVDGGFPNGWITGTASQGTPPSYGGSFAPPCWNVTTIRYLPNMHEYSRPGIDDDRGANNPLLSAHPGGVLAAMVDGSVRLLPNEIDLKVLKQLATRDDRLIHSREH